MDGVTKWIPELDERCLIAEAEGVRLDVKTLVKYLPQYYSIAWSMVRRGKND
jgi:hypothetical protein